MVALSTVKIQEVVSRTEARFIDSRQLKICATCFEITVSLLRVVEMIVTIAIPLFTDWSKTSAELLLTRLILLLCQVLSRITTKNGMFESVSSLLLPGMEVVTHYPILAATVGILIQLILKTKGTSQVRTCQVLLAEPGFQLSSLMFLLRDQGDTAGSAKKIFNLSSFSEVSKTEIKDVRMLISYLQHRQSIMSTSKQVLEDDEVCTICYANPISAVFTPCGHKSCRNCISHQMMSKKECFFCLTVVTAVHDLSGKQIITQNPLKHSI